MIVLAFVFLFTFHSRQIVICYKTMLTSRHTLHHFFLPWRLNRTFPSSADVATTKIIKSNLCSRFFFICYSFFSSYHLCVHIDKKKQNPYKMLKCNVVLFILCEMLLFLPPFFQYYFLLLSFNFYLFLQYPLHCTVVSRDTKASFCLCNAAF